MARFAIPAPTTVELAGSMSDFVDDMVALKALSDRITINTAYGPQAAVRCQVVDPMTGQDLGVRLLFWDTVQTQVLHNAQLGIDWSVGFIKTYPQQSDPTRSYFTLEAPNEAADIDWVEIDRALDTADRREAAQTRPTLVHSN